MYVNLVEDLRELVIAIGCKLVILVEKLVIPKVTECSRG